MTIDIIDRPTQDECVARATADMDLVEQGLRKTRDLVGAMSIAMTAACSELVALDWHHPERPALVRRYERLRLDLLDAMTNQSGELRVRPVGRYDEAG